MQKPLELTFRNVEANDQIKELVERNVEKLEQMYNRIISCSVAIEQLHNHHQKGNPFHVRIDIKIPHNQEIVIKREPQKSSNGTFALNAMIADAFDAARRALKKHVEIQRHDVKTHVEKEKNEIIENDFVDENG
jgi:ribosome-associated translation inhibitor RaiA